MGAVAIQRAYKPHQLYSYKRAHIKRDFSPLRAPLNDCVFLKIVFAVVFVLFSLRVCRCVCVCVYCVSGGRFIEHVIYDICEGELFVATTSRRNA